MGKKDLKKGISKQPTKKFPVERKKSILPWMVLVIAVAAFCLSPMLQNGFTNWDDELYVVNNMLLRGPDWKGIFSQPVVSNYHPLTIATLAFNYSVAKLNPHSYLILNLLLHLCNTALVFYFVWSISGKKIWAAVLVSLIFGIHPMHVESVAWVAERKDVLYTFFFLWSLIFYWKYLEAGKKINLWLGLLLFIFSLLSKPAAIVLPFVLFLLDYWKGRAWNKKIVTEKILFLLAAVIFAVVTFQIQSHKSVASLELHPLWTRLFFACHVVMIYFVRFFIPWPLSAFHPYPPQDNLGMSVLLSPLFVAGLAGVLWFFRKNKLVVFGLLFYVVNLLLVLQIIAIGNTLVSERYTYVPYIGLAFILGMVISERKNKNVAGWLVLTIITLVFGTMTYGRTQVWKNSGSLWTDVISHYPNAPVPRTNRANYNCKMVEKLPVGTMRDSLLQISLDDCNIALKTNPKHAKGYENRALIFLYLHRDKEALADADTLKILEPKNNIAYTASATALMRLKDYEKALADFGQAITLNPRDDFAYANRASILFNIYQKYSEARNDFDSANRISPKGYYYLNSAYCSVNLGDVARAKEDARMAIQMGEKVPESFRKSLNL